MALARRRRVRHRLCSPLVRPPLARPLAAMATLLVGVVFVVAAPATPAAATAHDFEDPVFSADARGDITTIGNVTTTCDPAYENDRWSAAESSAACHGARDGSPEVRNHAGAVMPPINNRLAMVDVDVDGDPATFSSSTARLTLPAGSVVLWAGLHWNGALSAPVSDQLYGSSHQAPPRSEADRFNVRLRTPASTGYRPLSAIPADGVHADTWDGDPSDATRTYAGYVDITDAVREGGAGAYTVADVQSCRGFGGCFGSWSITVAYAQRDLPARNLNVWHGWHTTSPLVDGGDQAFTVAGITPPPSGPVNARIGVVQADGDRGLGPDSLEIRSPSTPWTTFRTADRPLNASEGTDWFNSTTSVLGRRRPGADATPNHLANLNQDLALEQTESVVRNADRSLSFRVHTEGTEHLFSQVVHSAVEIHEPTIAVEKSVAPAGPVAGDAQVTWTIDVDNAGIDEIHQAVITDPLPPAATLVPGTVRYAAGGPADILGAKTEAAGDDQVDYDAATRTLHLRVGVGADADHGGTLGLPGSADGSDHLRITFDTQLDLPPGDAAVNIARAHGEGRHLDDPFGPLVTDDEAGARIESLAEADLGITKTDSGAVVEAVGDQFTYRLEALNAGPARATGVRITDQLDEHLRFVASDDCTATGRALSCDLGDLDPGAIREVTVEVAVVQLPGPGQSIPNVATIIGDLPDPDCTGTTPGALCNEAREETPQREVDETPEPTDPKPPPRGPAPTTPRPTDPSPPRHDPAPPRSVGPLPRTGVGMVGLAATGLGAITAGFAVRGVRRRTARA